MDPKRLRDLPWLSIVHAMLSDYWLEVPDPPISILANFLDYPHETRTLTYPTALNIFINQAFKLTVPTGVETRAIQDRTPKPRYSPAASLPTVSSLIVIDSPHAEAAHGQMTWITKMNAAPANLDIGAPKIGIGGIFHFLDHQEANDSWVFRQILGYIIKSIQEDDISSSDAHEFTSLDKNI
ncbi:unnamed protein product [Fusarium graminearum]|uniref:Uncharacterized protein n=1 Tax=Gibberella zeae TaxID=5518 RepID=A0A9N8WWS1_GIBZA|nr:unnamed protein product [Fusarium graminearum]